MRSITTIVLQSIKFVFALIILVLTASLRNPSLANYRSWIFWGAIASSIIVVISEFIGDRKNAIQKLLSLSLLTIIFCGLSNALFSEIRFQLMKQNVLKSNTEYLEELGQHFIVGYKKFENLKILVKQKAIGGIFITARNIQNKTKQDIKQDISTLQEIRRRQGLNPLWVAADQEGGIVSRLSPPLTALPALSEIVVSQKTISQRQQAVAEYAHIHGQELSEIGVNLNFAPVVDVNKGIVNPADKYSQIYRRAISTDKIVVAEVALQYCNILATYGVRCTIKHFPGLGRVDTDTHVDAAVLTASVDDLANDDWLPFRYVMDNSRSLMMLSHVRLAVVDAKHPVSFSNKVVTGILRKKWHYEGILVTDDFCMRAVYRSEASFEQAAVDAINAGVDLILIAFDADLYYPAMNVLLHAREVGALDEVSLQQSQARLDNDPPL